MTDTPNDDRLRELERRFAEIERERRRHAAAFGDQRVEMEPFFRRQDAVREEMRALAADTRTGVTAKLRVLNANLAPSEDEDDTAGKPEEGASLDAVLGVGGAGTET